jgi:hypothetical protein
MIFSIAKNTQMSQSGENSSSSVSLGAIEHQQLKNVAADSGQPHCRVPAIPWLGPMDARSRRAPSSGTVCVVFGCLGSLSATRSYSGINLFSIFRVVKDEMKIKYYYTDTAW